MVGFSYNLLHPLSLCMIIYLQICQSPEARLISQKRAPVTEKRIENDLSCYHHLNLVQFYLFMGPG